MLKLCPIRYGVKSFPYSGAQLSDWRYKQVAAASVDDYSSPSYDDSSWAIGVAPFGSWEDLRPDGLPAAPAFDSRFAEDFATTWTTNTSLWLRRTMSVTALPPAGIRVTAYIEDNCLFYMNGTLIIDSPDGPIGGNGQIFDISTSYITLGENVIAIRCNDEPVNGGISVTYADFILETL